MLTARVVPCLSNAKPIEVGKIYGIYDVRVPSTTIYIGSTETMVCVRYIDHIMKALSKTEGLRTNSPMYTHMCEEGLDNFRWRILHRIENTTRLELRKKEQGFLDEYQPRFNRNRAFCSPSVRLRDQRLRQRKR